ncbi:MAG: GntR family transcriptional regulator [Anaerolineales bacterium]|jgi:DNA-binding GntR family transcriptional regulator
MADINITFQQQAYQYIKDQIMNLGFKPGEYITDGKIAAHLNFSRTPVREAFHRLEKEGLLIYETRRGWKIYTLSLDDIHEIFDLKNIIEGMLARKAASCQDDRLRKSLQEAFIDMHRSAEENDTGAWTEADSRLHETIFNMAGNERAQNVINNLNDQWHRVRIGFVARTGRMERSASEHEAFVQAILEGNGEAAERHMRDHLERLREELVNLLENMVLPFVQEGV